jgi:hypothetical protein
MLGAEISRYTGLRSAKQARRGFVPISFCGFVISSGFAWFLGLVTNDRSREEGRHYTYQGAVRLHGCGASD